MDHGPEQRAPEGARGALLQVVGVADEDRDRRLLGDEVELVQSLFRPTKGQASQELLDGGIARPDGQKDQIAVLVADAAVGHQVGALVDAIQHVG